MARREHTLTDRPPPWRPNSMVRHTMPLPTPTAATSMVRVWYRECCHYAWFAIDGGGGGAAQLNLMNLKSGGCNDDNNDNDDAAADIVDKRRGHYH